MGQQRVSDLQWDVGGWFGGEDVEGSAEGRIECGGRAGVWEPAHSAGCYAAMTGFVGTS